MNSVWLSLIFKFLAMLATSDLFAVQRAVLMRMVDPRLVYVVEQLVKSVDGASIPGAEKKQEVLARVTNSPDSSIASLAKSTAGYLLNQVIEYAVAKTRMG